MCACVCVVCLCVCLCVRERDRIATLLNLYCTPPLPLLLRYSTLPLLHSTLLYRYSTLAYLLNRNCTLLYSTPTPLYSTLPLYCISLAISAGERRTLQLIVLYTHAQYDTDCGPVLSPGAVTLLHRCTVVVHAVPVVPAGPLGPPVSKAVQCCFVVSSSSRHSTLLHPYSALPYSTATARYSTRPLDSSTLL